MWSLRTTAVAAGGALVTAAGLRIARIARERGVSVVDVLADLPSVARVEATAVRRAAEGAIDDGRLAARAREQELTQVMAGLRRRDKSDD